jgi:hypothetical protein
MCNGTVIEPYQTWRRYHQMQPVARAESIRRPSCKCITPVFFRMPLFVVTVAEIRNVGYYPDTHAARGRCRCDSCHKLRLFLDEHAFERDVVPGCARAGMPRSLRRPVDSRRQQGHDARALAAAQAFRADRFAGNAVPEPIVDNTANRSSSAGSPGSKSSTRPPLS